jgi:hypothetical protein
MKTKKRKMFIYDFFATDVVVTVVSDAVYPLYVAWFDSAGKLLSDVTCTIIGERAATHTDGVCDWGERYIKFNPIRFQ